MTHLREVATVVLVVVGTAYTALLTIDPPSAPPAVVRAEVLPTPIPTPDAAERAQDRRVETINEQLRMAEELLRQYEQRAEEEQ